MCRYCLLNDKKSAQKVWFKDLVYKGTFRLSSRTPHIRIVTTLVHNLELKNVTGQKLLYPGQLQQYLKESL